MRAPSTTTTPKASSAMSCSALVMWNNGGMSVLIPKRNGKGYLKTPLWHSHVPAIAAIEASERIDMCGLDGYLNLDYRYREPDERREIMARVMPQLAAYYGFKEWREDPNAFWAILKPNDKDQATRWGA